MNSKPVATDLRGRSSVVLFSHKSSAPRPFKPLMACAVFALTLVGAFAVTAAQAGTTAVGAIAGSAGVSATGAATYAIPISLPPGTNGMQPSVALTYNSQSGDGAAGYGWTLSGLSAITRCPKTIDDDGVTQAVQFAVSPAPSDDFCLDGQHIPLIAGTGYVNGSAYRTEIQDFSEINSYTDSSATNGPSWFEIKDKSGRVYDYGDTTDSKIYAQGTTIVRVWALNQVRDPNGNYYNVTYQNNDTTTGDYWPLNVTYTGNSNTGTTPLHKIVFGWTPRSDSSVQVTYLLGSLITQTQLLSSITVKYNGSVTLSYTLNYPTTPSDYRNELQSVTECDGSGDCLQPTTIQWQYASGGWSPDQDTGVSVSDIAHATASHLMDVDGDGIMDLVFPDTSTGNWAVMFGLPGGGFGSKTDTGDPLNANYQYALPMDYNGDGRMDLIVPVGGGWQVLRANGGKTAGTGHIFNAIAASFPDLSANNSVTNQPIYKGNVWAADFFGRGMTDLLYNDGTNVYLAENGVSYTSYSAAPIVHSEQKTTLIRSTTSNFVDTPMAFDDSGRPGAQASYVTTHTCFSDGCTPPPPTSGYEALQAQGGTSGTPTLASMGEFSLNEAIPEPMNATGGGLTDLLTSAGYNYAFEISTNSGFNYIQTSISDTQVVDDIIADYYADGRQEALVSDPNPYTGFVLIRLDYSIASNADQFVTAVNDVSTAIPPGYVTGSARIGNIEANGLDDLVYAVKVNSGQYNWHFRLHSGGAPDLVTSIKDGLGNISTFTYGSLASGSPLYTKGDGAAYPIKDVQLPMQVVSSYSVSDGTGGNYTLNYTYTGARFESLGQGFLGFSGRTITDNFRQTTETVTYSQTFPWTGMLLSDKVISDASGSSGSVISDTENTTPEVLGYSIGTPCPDICFPFFDTSTTTTYNYNGTANQTARTVVNTLSQGSFDAYGNVISQQPTVTDGATGQTFNSNTSAAYSANTSDYCVGLMTGESVTRSSSALTRSLTELASSLSRVVNGYPSTPTGDFDTTHCRLNSQTVASGEGDGTTLTTKYTYDGTYGNVSETDVSGSGITPSPRKTQFDFTGGSGEFPTTITYFVSPTNLATHMSWNYALGFKTSDTDANGKTTTYTPDGFGRVESVTRPDGTQTQYTYVSCIGLTGAVACPTTGAYEVTTTQSPNDGSPSITTGFTAYDMKGRPVRQGSVLLGGVMSLVDTEYDSAGHVTGVTRPYFPGPGVIPFQTTYTYDDAFDRVKSVAEPANASDTCSSGCSDTTTLDYEVEAAGFAVIATHQAPDVTGTTTTQITTKYSDTLGRVLEMKDANSGLTLYSYDAFGDLLATADADNNVTNLSYDGLGHKTGMTDPNMGTWAYTVDALGEITCQIDAKNQYTVMVYDGLGRPMSKLDTTAAAGGCSASGTTSTWTYDQPGALGLPASVAATDNSFQRTYAYDTLERPSDVTTTVGNTPYDVSTSYDDFGRLQTVTYPVTVTPATDLTLVASATPASATVLQNVTVNLSGSGSTDPNSLPMTYAWSETAGPPDGQFTTPDEVQTGFSSPIPGNYSLQLEVSDANSAGALAAVSVTVQPVAPAAPTAKSPSYNGTISVGWSNVIGADSYYLYKSTDGTTFTQIPGLISSGAGGIPGQTSATVPGLSTGTYYFAVIACGNSVCGAEGPASSGITMILPPTAPTSMKTTPSGTTGSPDSTGSYTLSWTAPKASASASLATSYVVYESVGGGAYNPLPATANTSYPFSGKSDTTYKYYVVASNGAGPAPASATVSEYVLHVPGAPGRAVATPNAGNPRDPYTLSWTKPTSGGTTSYYIVNGNTGTTYTGLSASFKMSSDGVYQYYAQACNASGCGADSAAATVTVTGIIGGGGCPTCIQTAPTGGATTAPAPTAAPPSSSGGTAMIMPEPTPDRLAVASSATHVQSSDASLVGEQEAVKAVAVPLPVSSHALPVMSTLAALAETRQAYVAKLYRQAPEAVLQAEANHHAQERLPSLLPLASAKDVLAWNARETARARQNPNGPAYAPPAYIVYGGARIAPATGTPYRFAVNYQYDPSSGGLLGVQNAQTGFVYWQAATSTGAAPVDAFGHLQAYTDGNNVSTVLTYDEATGAVTGIGTGIAGSSAVQQLAYTWDGFGNLTQRCDVNRGLAETFTYSGINGNPDNLNRLATSSVTTGGAPGTCGQGATAGASIAVSYDPIGNIQTRSNSGLNINASYGYGGTTGGPHAVTSIKDPTGAVIGSYAYDLNGNMICRDTAGNSCSGTGFTPNITWNADNLPTAITSPNGSSSFSYGPDMQRYAQTATDSSGNTTSTTYIGSLFEVVTNSSGTQYRHNIMAVGGTVAVHTIDQGGNVQTNYIHSDHLGSSDILTDDTGNIATDPTTGEPQIMSFDAFGMRRDPNNWSYDLTAAQIGGLKAKTDKGYTGQEQLDNVGLVHMNGRVYDPSIGRMISADPTIPGLTYSQAFNRYAYVYNNPLNSTDPSGYCPICNPFSSSNPLNPVNVINTTANALGSAANALGNAAASSISLATGGLINPGFSISREDVEDGYHHFDQAAFNYLFHPAKTIEYQFPGVGNITNVRFNHSQTLQNGVGDVLLAASVVVDAYFPEFTYLTAGIYGGYESYVSDLHGGTALVDLEHGGTGFATSYIYGTAAQGFVNEWTMSSATGWDFAGDMALYSGKVLVKAYAGAVIGNEATDILVDNGLSPTAAQWIVSSAGFAFSDCKGPDSPNTNVAWNACHP